MHGRLASLQRHSLRHSKAKPWKLTRGNVSGTDGGRMRHAARRRCYAATAAPTTLLWAKVLFRQLRPDYRNVLCVQVAGVCAALRGGGAAPRLQPQIHCFISIMLPTLVDLAVLSLLSEDRLFTFSGFVLTTKGSVCRWRVYAPRCEEEVLRRDCSPDYSQEDIGEPVLEVELQPGVRLIQISMCCS